MYSRSTSRVPSPLVLVKALPSDFEARNAEGRLGTFEDELVKFRDELIRQLLIQSAD